MAGIVIVDPAQITLDLATTLRNRGADAALEASGEWAAQAWHVLKALAAGGQEFTIADVTGRVGAPPSPNAAGSVILNGLKAGLIVNVGWTPAEHVAAHRRRTGVYRGRDAA